MTEIEWIPYPKNKPNAFTNCLVCNSFNREIFRAIYYSDDVFVLYDPDMRTHPCLHVTHYIQIPELL